jgi:sugar phosphate isomerase/epimerase
MFKYAICNEVFEGWDFADTCRAVRQAGYDGIELAPFTLSDRPAELTAAERTRFRRTIEQAGLQFAGLHWLMMTPKGLHATSADDALRERSWKHVFDMIDLCGDLGGGVVVFGSPKQRGTTPGVSHEQALRYFKDGFASVAKRAEERGVTVLPEALPLSQCDVMTTLAEAAGIVNEIASPAIQTMFDVHNSEDETESAAELIEKYFHMIRHVHLQEMDGKYPGAGSYDFAQVMQTLKRLSYKGWVSMEVMDFTPGPEKIAVESLRYIKGLS